MSPYKPRKPGSLKAALALLVARLGGNDAAGAVLGISGEHMRRLTDDDHRRDHIRYADVLKLEAKCGEPIVTGFGAEQLHCIVERIDCAARAPVAAVVARITSETGEVLSAAAADLARGTFTRATARLVLRETDDLLPAVLELRDAARAMLSGEAP